MAGSTDEQPPQSAARDADAKASGGEQLLAGGQPGQNGRLIPDAGGGLASAGMDLAAGVQAGEHDAQRDVEHDVEHDVEAGASAEAGDLEPSSELGQKPSVPHRMADALRSAPARSREALSAVQLDVPWARTRLAGWVRENFLRFILNPIMDYYARRKATGVDKLADLKLPVILVANHASHMDTPVILSALPRRLRKRTVVVAAADYFYRNRLTAWIVSMMFNTTPIDRRAGAGGWSKNGDHLEALLAEGWSLLLYPEGTRSRSGSPGRVRRGAAVLAATHGLALVPIRVSGTGEAMPPGRVWPKKGKVGKPSLKRHKIMVVFGDPIPPSGDATAMIKSVQQFFEETSPSPSPYISYARRLRRKDHHGEEATTTQSSEAGGASRKHLDLHLDLHRHRDRHHEHDHDHDHEHEHDHEDPRSRGEDARGDV